MHPGMDGCLKTRWLYGVVAGYSSHHVQLPKQALTRILMEGVAGNRCETPRHVTPRNA